MKSPFSSPVGGVGHPQLWVLYRRLENLRVLSSTSVVPSGVLFWITGVPGIYLSYFSSLGVTAPSDPIITGVTLAFYFSSSSSSLWYFSSFSHSFFLMFQSLIALSIISADFWFLYVATISG